MRSTQGFTIRRSRSATTELNFGSARRHTACVGDSLLCHRASLLRRCFFAVRLVLSSLLRANRQELTCSRLIKHHADWSSRIEG